VNQTIRGAKVPVQVCLDADLVDEAGKLTSDLAETLETLLAAFIGRERSKQDTGQHALDAEVRWLNEIHDQYGLPGADFSPL
jgi:Post-segregation antitoxin CcdA